MGPYIRLCQTLKCLLSLYYFTLFAMQTSTLCYYFEWILRMHFCIINGFIIKAIDTFLELLLIVFKLLSCYHRYIHLVFIMQRKLDSLHCTVWGKPPIPFQSVIFSLSLWRQGKTLIFITIVINIDFSNHK